MNEVFIIALPCSTGLPKPEKALRDLIFFSEQEARDYLRDKTIGMQDWKVFRCVIEVREEVSSLTLEMTETKYIGK